MATATVPVGSLTDAELAVLARPRTRLGPRPVMPVWAVLPRDRRADAVRDARIGLVARRLLAPEARGRADVRRDVRSVLALRESATVVVAVVRATPRGRDHWYAHLVRDVALLEQVSPDGVHRFALAAAATLAEHVAAAVLHPQAAAATAPTPDDETDWLRADLELRGAAGPDRLALVSGPGGSWLLAPGAGRAATPLDPGAAAGLVSAALARACGADPDGD